MWHGSSASFVHQHHSETCGAGDSSRSTATNLIVFGQALLEAINKLHRHKTLGQRSAAHHLPRINSNHLSRTRNPVGDRGLHHKLQILLRPVWPSSTQSLLQVPELETNSAAACVPSDRMPAVDTTNWPVLELRSLVTIAEVLRHFAMRATFRRATLGPPDLAPGSTGSPVLFHKCKMEVGRHLHRPPIVEGARPRSPESCAGRQRSTGSQSSLDSLCPSGPSRAESRTAA